MKKAIEWLAKHPRAAGALFGAAMGLATWGMCRAGAYPAETIARRLSEDGELSETYVGLIRGGQAKLAQAFWIAAALAGWMDAGRLAKWFIGLPFWRVAAAAGLAAALLGHAVQERLFDGIPHITDATSHAFQAKIFAAGRLHADVPACPESFWQPNVVMTTTGKWFTKYTPGHALLLAAGIRTGLMPWVLPLCLGLTVIALGRLLEDHDEPAVARLSMVAFALSPLALLACGSYMSHTTSLALAGWGLWAWLRTRREGGGIERAAAGLAAGMLFALSALARPTEFVLVGMVGFGFFLFRKRGDWEWLAKSMPALVIGAAPVLAFWGYWNRELYGSVWAVGYGFTTESVMRPSFQGQYGFSEAFGFRDAMAQLAANLDRFNRSMLGFPCSFLFLPFALLGKRRALKGLCAWGIAAVAGVYFFYRYPAELEVRYYYLALPLFAYLSTRGLVDLAREASGRWRAAAKQALFVSCAAFYAHGAISYWPDYLVPAYRGNYENCTIEIRREVERRGLENAVVAISSRDTMVYSSGFVHNDPGLANDVVYARAEGEGIECLRSAFPGKSIWVYEVDGPARGLRPADAKKGRGGD